MAISNFGRNVKALRDIHGLTQQQLADSLNVLQNTVSGWETRDKRPRSQDVIDKICELYDVTEQDLFGFGDGLYARQAGSEGNFMQAVTTEESYAPVWCYAACGEAREVFEQSGEEHWVPPSVLKRWNNEGGCIVAKGDSMNLLFPDGAYLYVVPHDKRPVSSGDIAWVKVNGDDACVKRLKMFDGIVVLEPESTNPEHRRRVIDKDDPDAPEVRLLGKVVWFDYELA
jgi:repressor LexA